MYWSLGDYDVTIRNFLDTIFWIDHRQRPSNGVLKPGVATAFEIREAEAAKARRRAKLLLDNSDKLSSEEKE